MELPLIIIKVCEAILKQQQYNYSFAPLSLQAYWKGVHIEKLGCTWPGGGRGKEVHKTELHGTIYLYMYLWWKMTIPTVSWYFIIQTVAVYSAVYHVLGKLFQGLTSTISEGHYPPNHVHSHMFKKYRATHLACRSGSLAK